MQNEHTFAFKNASICNADRVETKVDFWIDNGKFRFDTAAQKQIDLSNYYCYPGLFNAHDHMMGNYFPKVGNGPYMSWKAWDEDLKNAKVYKERSKLSVEDIYELATFRNIISGVTSICDHIPHIINDQFIEKSNIRIVEQYCLAHEMSSYELKWGDDHAVEIKNAREKDIPFITHMEEGFDEESLRGINILEKKNGLFNRAVLVHCIGCDQKDIEKIANANASMVWCPHSNLFMFNKTANIREFLIHEVNVSLGTDSPMSGSINILAELKTAKETYKHMYGKNLSSKIFDENDYTSPCHCLQVG